MFMLSIVMCMWLLGRNNTHPFGSSNGRLCFKKFILGESLGMGVRNDDLFLYSLSITSLDNVVY